MNTNLRYLFFFLFAICCCAESRASHFSGPRYEGPFRISAEGLVHNQQMQKFSVDALNLKGSIASQNSVQQTTSAISLSEADINAISAVGNTWMDFIASPRLNFSMNIGIANNSSPQTWTLPANFNTNFNGAGRRDFLAPTSIPLALRITGANKVMKSYQIDDLGNWLLRYDHFNVTSTIVNHIGTSYDLEFGTDQDFDEPDFEFCDVPYDLGDTWSATEDYKDYISGLSLVRTVRTTNVDAYGTISTPDGVFNCLRMSYVTQKYTRPDEASSFTLQSTKNSIGFITKEGYYFNADVSVTSGTANVSNFTYRKVVSTAALTETNDVKLNNDSKGVTINTDNTLANPSAILDIKNDSLGILIPRIAKANRPKSPATGLLVYQIDNTSGFYYFDGSAWQRLAQTTPSPGRVAAQETESLKGKETLSQGTVFIKFESPKDDFEYVNIQIQPEGDCNGLFIAKKTREGFEVRELQKGKSNVKFSWKID